MNKPSKLDSIVPILADVGVSVTDLKRNPAAVIAAAREQQVAILSRNRPVGYIVSPEVWSFIEDVLADRELLREAQDALDEDGENVKLDLDAYL
ncbi:type II toxin-antitoxin system prevent-host-death family antitoxin [Pelagerythrobacter sp.]|uniref:type II toxin-antitoxin system prevent-host-death family antitoxin n=1 Tax=Pelagerythrobacter sp. TaxID=2800702 RepID=UPI0035B125BB